MKLLIQEGDMKVVIICALLMLAFIGLGQAAVYNAATHLAIVLWSFAVLALGVSFYRLRMRNRLWYGGFELLVALVASYFILLNLYQHALALTAEIVVSRMIILFAAVYVIARALTNIGEALPSAGRFTKIWNRLFSS
jgi:hypothetical protein